MKHTPILTEEAFYDDLSNNYDEMVNWDSRIKRELPFLQELIGNREGLRILDVACGTGGHALALAQLGHKVVGVDISEGMIQEARKKATNLNVEAEFLVGGFVELTEILTDQFDIILCLGNSLPHLTEDETLKTGLGNFYSLLKPGGYLLLQNRNFDKVLLEQERFMPLSQKVREEREILFLRFYDYHEDLLAFNMVTMIKEQGKWQMTTKTTLLKPLTHAYLTGILGKVGFSNIKAFGSYGKEEFSPEKSGDLIILAER